MRRILVLMMAMAMLLAVTAPAGATSKADSDRSDREHSRDRDESNRSDREHGRDHDKSDRSDREHGRDDEEVSKSKLRNFDDGSLVGRGASTWLRRSDDGVDVRIRSRNLTPGNVYTVWLVIFNTPEGCLTNPCGEPDIGNAAATPSVIWSGASGVANHAGNLNISGSLSVGNPQGYQQLLTDLDAPDPGFLDAEGAEIHMIVRDHGPVTGNADQFTTYEGDCTAGSSFGLGSGAYGCSDPQFSIHQS